MRFAVIGTGSLAQACRTAIESRPEWELAEKTEPKDWLVLCGPTPPSCAELARMAQGAEGVLCATPVLWRAEDARPFLRMFPGRKKALRPECARPHIAGIRAALDGDLLGTVGVANLTRKRPLPQQGELCDALSQCAMEEASAVLHLLGRPRSIFCVRAGLGEGEQVSLTLQLDSGAIVNIQGAQGGTTEPYFAYEYAGRYGLADYDSRQGALRLFCGDSRLNEEAWSAETCAKAMEDCLGSRDENGMSDLLRIQLAARRSCDERRVIKWEEVEL